MKRRLPELSPTAYLSSSARDSLKVRAWPFLVLFLLLPVQKAAQGWCLRNVHCVDGQMKFLTQNLVRAVWSWGPGAEVRMPAFPLTMERC